MTHDDATVVRVVRRYCGVREAARVAMDLGYSLDVALVWCVR